MKPATAQLQNAPYLGKLQHHHLDRMAFVYVRQSTLQQVSNHQESTQMQYNLVQRAQQLGWEQQRIVVIDDDLGKSATSVQGRPGFQRLLSEIGLNHAGIVLGVDMSRLTRCCTDWHHLLETCALFSTLIADLEGVYDPCEHNDRLLLGLKGTLSESELHLITQRLQQGKLLKAKRGELNCLLPVGYVRYPNGDITLDPDEQVQYTIRLIFDTFAKLGTVNAVLRLFAKQTIQLGFRGTQLQHDGLGALQWHRVHRNTLYSVLRHPIYAGAYTYGRHQVEPSKKQPGKPKTGRVLVNPSRWYTCIRDHFPAYISWQRYERNQERLESNRFRAQHMGAAREGQALLPGLLVCGRCGARMSVRYAKKLHTYICMSQRVHVGGSCCQHIAGRVLDAFVAQQALRVLQPAHIDLSIQAVSDVRKERQQTHQVWKHKLERVAYEADRAGRHYRAVEPENRMVARQLGRDWEAKLQQQQQLQEEYHRFCQQEPAQLSQQECDQLHRLAGNIEALWQSAQTPVQVRKRLLRELLQTITLEIQGDSEQVTVTLLWVGGCKSQHLLVRPVGSVGQLSYYKQLRQQLQAWHEEHLAVSTMAERLNQAGIRPARCRGERWEFTPSMVSRLLREMGIRSHQSCLRPPATSVPDNTEWSLAALGHHLGIPKSTLYAWTKKGVVPGQLHQGRWQVQADRAKQQQLRQLHQQPASYKMRVNWLTRQLQPHRNKEENHETARKQGKTKDETVCERM